MSVHYVHSGIVFAADQAVTDDEFDAFLDEVTDQLYDLADKDGGLIDSTMTGSLATRTASIMMGVEADSWQDAARLFSANVRAALHAAECATPGWPTFKPTEELTAEKVPASLGGRSRLLSTTSNQRSTRSLSSARMAVTSSGPVNPAAATGPRPRTRRNHSSIDGEGASVPSASSARACGSAPSVMG